MTWDTLVRYMTAAYAAVRANEIVPADGHPAMVMIHDCFRPLSDWDYFFSTGGAAWINYALDTHIYQAFADAPNMSDDQQLMGICGQQSTISISQSKLPTVSPVSTKGRAIVDLVLGAAGRRRVLTRH